MSSGARLSAFAKRRKLDNGFTRSETSSPEPFSSKANNVIPNPPRANARVLEEAPQKIGIDSDLQTSTFNVREHNSFDTLVAANVVNFSASREVGVINDTTLKIRLSKGQKCVLQGVAQLWVREGSVLLQGAILSESTRTYTIFGSSTDELLALIADSRNAELQLESIPCYDPDFPSVLNIPGRFGRISQSLPASFELVETDQTCRQAPADGSVGKLYEQVEGLLMQQLNLVQVTKPTRVKRAHGPKALQPKILVAGKHSSATSKLSMVTINRLLTGRFPQYAVERVAFLDLDHISPTFACPGTVSLSIHTVPTLGPSFSSPLRPQCDAPNRLICSYYLGFGEQSALSAYNANLVEQILAKVPENTPIAIRVGKNFGDLQRDKLLEFASLVNMSTCICAAVSKSSTLYEAIKSATDHLDSTLAQVKVSTAQDTHSSLEAHKLAMRSHFYLRNFTNCSPQWSLPSMLTQTTNKIHLPSDDNPNGLTFVVIRGGVLRYEDIAEALAGSLVALVREAGTTLTLPSDQQESEDLRDRRHDYNAYSQNPEILMQGFENASTFFEFMGLALVEAVTDTLNSFTLVTNIAEGQLREHLAAEQRFGLVLEKPGINNEFTSQLLRN